MGPTESAARDPALASSLRAVVAIPARNEAERIGGCLSALGSQVGVEAGSLGVVLFLNNCTDGTPDEVAALLPTLGLPARVIRCDRAGAHAGWARREAMQAASAWLDEAGAADGVLLTTDADSRVPPDWVACNLAAIAAGADAVAGGIGLDPEEARRLPDALHALGRLEACYDALLTELEARIDPLAHDPWPRHATASGASLAVRRAAYHRAGGMPALPVGEDRAFVAALRQNGARVRHDPAITVVTSGRLEGRAPGGAADTMRQRCMEPDAPCDPRLEALSRAVLRYGWRRHLRRLCLAGRLDRLPLWAPWLGLPAAEARAIARLDQPEAVLAAVEAASPRLAVRPLRPRDLPAQIRRAQTLLVLLRSAPALRWPGLPGRAGPAVERAARGGPVPPAPRPSEGVGHA
ncbi:glycosyltransferase [Methylobacterium sp. ID0610]|uniref:glycosyltransferase n=1 Tax=Methylobacterium carpenticola TaxID=3344827 RepID=UPI0036A1722E